MECLDVSPETFRLSICPPLANRPAPQRASPCHRTVAGRPRVQLTLARHPPAGRRKCCLFHLRDRTKTAKKRLTVQQFPAASSPCAFAGSEHDRLFGKEVNRA